MKGIDRSAYTEYMSPSEYKVWDNWPFLLIFAAVLTLEWWLRKRHWWLRSPFKSPGKPALPPRAFRFYRNGLMKFDKSTEHDGTEQFSG